MRSAVAVAALFGGTGALADTTMRGRALAPLVTTTPGTTTFLSACGFYPPIDPGVTVTTTVIGESIGGATVSIGAGLVATDTLAVNPDPTEPCSFDPASLPPGSDCGPCPGLAVSGVGTPLISITGASSAAAYTACLRRVVYRSTAFGGEEGLGPRTITFTATSSAGLASSGTKTIEELAADTLGCSALLTSVSVTLTTTLTPDFSLYPLGYDSDCIGTACNALLYLAPAGLTVVPGSSGVVGRAQVFFNLFSRGPPVGIFIPTEDRVTILPDPADPASTYSDPCPGLGFRVLYGVAPGTPTLGLFTGVEVYGPGSGAAYTSCLRRAVYYNIASSPATATLGLRPTAVRAYSVRTAAGESFFALTLSVTVLPPDGTCTITPCLRGPTDAELTGAGGTPSASGTPIPSPGTGPGATASGTPVPSLGASASSSPAVSPGGPGASASRTRAPVGASATRTPFNTNLLPPNFRRVTWFSHGDCSTDQSALSRFGPNAAFSTNPDSASIRHRSVVVVRDGVCNYVPSAPANLSYVVTCATDGSATISFCSSQCGFCPYSYTLRGDNSQCWPAAPGYGAAALRIDCGRQSLTNLNPFTGDAYIRWIENPVCQREIEQATHMLIPQNVCHVVPGATAATNSGYRITCDDNGNGSGTFEVCNNNCASCGTATRFTGINQCNPNDPATGSASVRFHCGSTVLTAQQEELGSTSGAFSKEASLITAAGTIIVGAAAAAAGMGLA